MYPGGKWYSISICTCGTSVGNGASVSVLTIDEEFVEGKLKALTTEADFAGVVKF